MDRQQRIIEMALRDDVPDSPSSRRSLAFDDALRIVDETVDHIGRHGDAVTYKYVSSHRRRLAISLAMIPFAEHDDAALLDVGCFGYMSFWARRHLGYARVEGVEFRSDLPGKSRMESIRVGDQTVELNVHNFDIAAADWPMEGRFDTVLFFETLEHINSDPMSVVLNISKHMKDDGVLVTSVPNSVSHKTLLEFVAGMPPWNYWFYSPDLSHEARHCFEYTPFVFKVVLLSAGFDLEAFKTFCGFDEPARVAEAFAMGEALSIPSRLFGDIIIAVAHKKEGAEIVRYPDCVYDCEKYYRSTFPVISPRQHAAVRHFRERYMSTSADLEAARAKLAEAEARLRAAEDATRGKIAEAEDVIKRLPGLVWLSDPASAAHFIAREVWFERQRWGLPYKISRVLRRIWRGA